MKINQAFNDKAVQHLMYAAKGDLILDESGNLCYRCTYDADFKELPFDQHTIGRTLAMITSKGWLLMIEGAAFIVENCPMESKQAMNCLAAMEKCR